MTAIITERTAKPSRGESEDARLRMGRAGERPLCLADWSRALFVHYAVDPAALQPHVPFPLDLFRGQAYVSLVAFSQRNVRPTFGCGLGRLGRCLAARCARPVTEHAFLNLRTYVVHRGERAIYFLAEWIPNFLDRAFGALAYGLPYRLARLRYDYAADGRPKGGSVSAGGKCFRFRAHVDPAARPAPAASGLCRFLLERYTAFTGRGSTGRRFRIWHAPWAQTPAAVTTLDASLLKSAAPWFGACRAAGAHFSSGVRDVWIGPPRRPDEAPRRTATPVALARAARAAAPLVALPLIVAAMSGAPQWAVMWAVAFALFFACKWVTWRRAGGGACPRTARAWGYLFAWVGMDARAFLDPARKPAHPARSDWAAPAAKAAAGAALVFWGVALVPAGHPLLAGWVGMVGLALLLHFGTFHLLALLWRHAGVDATPLMREPTCSKSLAEFWSVRWNRGFHQLALDLLFRPAVRLGLRPAAALLATFVASGVVHESVISLPARGGWGLPTLYFAVQGAGVWFERTAAGRRLGLGRGITGRAFMLGCTVLPLPWLFHPAFVGRVIVPFLGAVGARVH